jgi:signal transduction histidine kinase
VDRRIGLSLGGYALLAVFAGGLLLTQSSAGQQIFSTEGFEPHGHCFLWIPTLVRLYSVSDLLIGLSYTVIAVMLTYLVYRASRDIPFHWVFLAFGAFIFTCGITHFMDVITLWTPTYWAAAGAKALTAIASVSTAIIMPPLVPRILNMVGSLRLSEERKGQIALANTALASEIRRREKVEEELRAALQREHELSEFRMNVIMRLNHEFRTPLASVRTAGEMLTRYYDQLAPAERDLRLKTIDTEIEHMTVMLEDILTIGRLDTGSVPFQPQDMDLNEFCRSLIGGLRVRAADAQRIVYKPDTKCKTAYADSRLVGEILTNLLHNAIKYSPQGGVVRCELSCASGFATLRVSDEGIGISRQDIPNIFETFYRGTNSGDISGTGLGLSIVRRAVELHRGMVEVQSIPERGTTFTVKLPIEREKA